MNVMPADSLQALLAPVIAPHASILFAGEVLPGELLTSLRPGRVVAVSPDQTGWSGEEGMPLEYCQLPLDELESDASFDCIIMEGNLLERGDMTRTLHTLRALCRNNGILVLWVGEQPSVVRRTLNLFSHYGCDRESWLPDHLSESLLETAGFSIRGRAGSWLLAQARPVQERRRYSYSIVIPCYNEEGNIAECVERIPDLQREYEIIVVNDGSTDRTAAVVRSLMASHPHLKLVDYGKNRGKGYATRAGLNAATKEVLMILDADMAVRPEDLPLFMEPFEMSDAAFVNGTRMIHPFTREAMGPVHVFGNRMFASLLAMLLNHPLTDTLCGTKCLFRKDYQFFDLRDPDWPDFDMLFEAARMNLKIVELPIRYQPRLAGVSKMKTFQHGLLMLLGAFRGYLKLKTDSGQLRIKTGEM